jgi:hypothetical protein
MTGGFLIYCAISLFLGFCGFVDSLVQPRWAYTNAHKSKFFWVLVNMVGMLSIVGGAVTWFVYSYLGTRRAVVRKGGYNRTVDRDAQHAANWLDAVESRRSGSRDNH